MNLILPKRCCLEAESLEQMDSGVCSWPEELPSLFLCTLVGKSHSILRFQRQLQDGWSLLSNHSTQLTRSLSPLPALNSNVDISAVGLPEAVKYSFRGRCPSCLLEGSTFDSVGGMVVGELTMDKRHKLGLLRGNWIM